ncbi:MAG: hypothetical protein JKX91_06585 [Rhizobiaceae bacterium]|nr:hypothetical protein [Rhizobiaceae bacterium]
MSDNQYIFEVIRDIGYAIMRMDHDKILAISVIKDTDTFYTFRTSNGQNNGLSETSQAIEKAFKVTRGSPDPRDTRIKKLEKALSEISDWKLDPVFKVDFGSNGERDHFRGLAVRALDKS